MVEIYTKSSVPSPSAQNASVKRQNCSIFLYLWVKVGVEGVDDQTAVSTVQESQIQGGGGRKGGWVGGGEVGRLKKDLFVVFCTGIMTCDLSGILLILVKTAYIFPCLKQMPPSLPS